MSETEPTGDIDPDMAAEAMQSDATQPLEDQPDTADIEIGPTAPEEEIGIMDRLLATEPHIPLDSDELSDPWQPDQGGSKRIYRGIMKLGDIEGLPAIADIVIGIAEVFVTQSNGEDQPDADADQPDPDADQLEDQPEPPEPQSNGEGVPMSEVNQ